MVGEAVQTTELQTHLFRKVKLLGTALTEETGTVPETTSLLETPPTTLAYKLVMNETHVHRVMDFLQVKDVSTTTFKAN